MEMEKKNLAIIILAVVLAASGIGNIILAITGGLIKVAPSDMKVLKVATTSNPVTFDPCDTWDSVSNDVLNQVVEPLIFYDYPTETLVPRLCESWEWTWNGAPSTLHINFKLRENVFFHDGSKFNATAVKFTFDRLNYFGNTSGTLPDTQIEAHPSSLYKINATTPLIKQVIIHSEYNCTIELNKAFAPFEGLLSYTASSIISPASHSATEMIDLSTDLTVGTGPFKLIKYTPNGETRFARWERYYRTGTYFDEVVYVFYADAVTANNAMLALDIDYLGSGMASLKQTFKDDPDISVVEVGTATIYWYVGFNNEAVNITWRKAIHFAFNYTYFLQDIEEGIGIKANSLVPPGFPGRNETVTAGYFDIPKARQFLIDDGVAPATWTTGSQVGDDFTPGSHETEWTTADFRTLKFRTRPGSNFMQLLLAQFENDMAMIGLVMDEQSMTWSDYIQEATADPNFMNIYQTGWGPDYFETFNMIQPLVDPLSSANYGQVDIPEINTYLALAAAETNTAQRLEYYETLQYLIHDVYYCNMPLEYELLYVVHAKTLQGFPYNINRDVYWYSCYW